MGSTSWTTRIAAKVRRLGIARALTPAWTPLNYHPIQAKLWLESRRFVAVTAGRGSGKTEISKRRLVMHLAYRKPWGDPRYFYGGPTYKQAKRVAWDHLRRLIPHNWIARVSVGELFIETIWGSRLYIVGLDAPQRIEGNQWDGGVIDESCDIKPGTFQLSILPALTHRYGWCWRIGVPKRVGPGAAEYREFFESGLSGAFPDRAAYTWPSSDILTPDQLAIASHNMDAKDYTEQMGGVFVDVGGGIFYTFSRAENVRPCAYRPDLPLIIGSDFNVDPMAWVIGHAYGERFEVIDELWLRDANTRMALDTLWQRYQDHRAGFEFYGDASSHSRKTSASVSDYDQILADERFRKAGRRVFYPLQNPAVADRFSSTNAMIENHQKQRRLFIDPHCKHLIADLEARHYAEGTREPADSGDLGHASDALGYVIHYRWPFHYSEGSSGRVYAASSPT